MILGLLLLHVSCCTTASVHANIGFAENASTARSAIVPVVVKMWPRTDGIPGHYYHNSKTNKSTFDMPKNLWIEADGALQYYYHSHYSSSNWVTWDEKKQMDILRKVAFQGKQFCQEIITKLQESGYIVGYDLYSRGMYKDVIHVTNAGRHYVAKVSYGTENVKNHIKEIQVQKECPISEFVVQCTDNFQFNLSNNEPVYIEIQAQGVPMDVRYKTASREVKDELHEKMVDLRCHIRDKGYDIDDYNYYNVAMFHNETLLVHDLGKVVEGLSDVEFMRPGEF